MGFKFTPFAVPGVGTTSRLRWPDQDREGGQRAGPACQPCLPEDHGGEVAQAGDQRELPQSGAQLGYTGTRALDFPPFSEKKGALCAPKRALSQHDQVREKWSRQAFSDIETNPLPLQALWPLQLFIDVLHSA